MPYYAVVNGREEGVFSSWQDCRPHVFAYKGAHFRKFENRNEAEEYYQNDGDYFIYPIYVDGACRYNGYPHAEAGYGVYYGDGDSETCQYHWMTLILMELFQLINELNFGQ